MDKPKMIKALGEVGVILGASVLFVTFIVFAVSGNFILIGIAFLMAIVVMFITSYID